MLLVPVAKCTDVFIHVLGLFASGYICKCIFQSQNCVMQLEQAVNNL